jgi:hypothetical protein
MASRDQPHLYAYLQELQAQTSDLIRLALDLTTEGAMSDALRNELWQKLVEVELAARLAKHVLKPEADV